MCQPAVVVDGTGGQFSPFLCRLMSLALAVGRLGESTRGHTLPQPMDIEHSEELAPRPQNLLFNPQQSTLDRPGSMTTVETNHKTPHMPVSDRVSASGHDDCSSDTSSNLTEINSEEFPAYFVERDDRLFSSHGCPSYPFPVDGHEQNVRLFRLSPDCHVRTHTSSPRRTCSLNLCGSHHYESNGMYSG